VRLGRLTHKNQTKHAPRIVFWQWVKITSRAPKDTAIGQHGQLDQTACHQNQNTQDETTISPGVPRDGAAHANALCDGKRRWFHYVPYSILFPRSPGSCITMSCIFVSGEWCTDRVWVLRGQNQPALLPTQRRRVLQVLRL
jgi:hypothetical protein